MKEIKSIAITGKGGSGKTMLATIMIQLLAERYHGGVLAIDADSAMSLPYTLGIPVQKTVSRLRKGVREAVLEYRITASNGTLSLADITLHTGRTHQIRVQFASRRHPLWGDGKYGSHFKGTIALQSARLCFLHPETGEPMEFALEKPDTAPWNV